MANVKKPIFATYPVVLTCMVVYLLSVLFNMLKGLIKHGRNYFEVKARKRPEILEDNSLGVHNNIKVQHINLHYVADGDENNQLVLFLHGFPDFWYTWRHQLKEFKENYRVVAVDLRGYGLSDKPENTEDYNIKILAEDIYQLITALAPEDRKAILVAHDWGGAIAWRVAIAYPNLLQKLVIINSPHPLSMRRLMWSTLEQFRMSWYILFFQWPWIPELWMRNNDIQIFDLLYRSKGHEIMTEEELEAYKFTFSAPGAFTPPINYYRATMKPQTESLNLHARITVPTLVIWGEEDTALSLNLATDCARYVDNYRVKVIEGAGHFVHMSHYRKVNSILTDFFKADCARLM